MRECETELEEKGTRGRISEEEEEEGDEGGKRKNGAPQAASVKSALLMPGGLL